MHQKTVSPFRQASAPDELPIQDLFEGAYLMCRGFNLKDLTVMDGQGKKVVTFVLAGDAIGTASEEYRSGRASCNVAMLKCTMSRLKDMMFDRIRSMERAERTCSDYPRSRR